MEEAFVDLDALLGLNPKNGLAFFGGEVEAVGGGGSLSAPSGTTMHKKKKGGRKPKRSTLAFTAEIERRLNMGKSRGWPGATVLHNKLFSGGTSSSGTPINTVSNYMYVQWEWVGGCWGSSG